MLSNAVALCTVLNYAYFSLQISNLEKEGKDYIERQVSQLKTQVEALTDKCHKVQLEAELSKAEQKNIKVCIDLNLSVTSTLLCCYLDWH